MSIAVLCFTLRMMDAEQAYPDDQQVPGLSPPSTPGCMRLAKDEVALLSTSSRTSESPAYLEAVIPSESVALETRIVGVQFPLEASPVGCSSSNSANAFPLSPLSNVSGCISSMDVDNVDDSSQCDIRNHSDASIRLGSPCIAPVGTHATNDYEDVVADVAGQMCSVGAVTECIDFTLGDSVATVCDPFADRNCDVEASASYVTPIHCELQTSMTVNDTLEQVLRSPGLGSDQSGCVQKGNAPSAMMASCTSDQNERVGEVPEIHEGGQGDRYRLKSDEDMHESNGLCGSQAICSDVEDQATDKHLTGMPVPVEECALNTSPELLPIPSSQGSRSHSSAASSQADNAAGLQSESACAQITMSSDTVDVNSVHQSVSDEPRGDASCSQVTGVKVHTKTCVTMIESSSPRNATEEGVMSNGTSESNNNSSPLTAEQEVSISVHDTTAYISYDNPTESLCQSADDYSDDDDGSDVSSTCSTLILSQNCPLERDGRASSDPDLFQLDHRPQSTSPFQTGPQETLPEPGHTAHSLPPSFANGPPVARNRTPHSGPCCKGEQEPDVDSQTGSNNRPEVWDANAILDKPAQLLCDSPCHKYDVATLLTIPMKRSPSPPSSDMYTSSSQCSQVMAAQTSNFTDSQLGDRLASTECSTNNREPCEKSSVSMPCIELEAVGSKAGMDSSATHIQRSLSSSERWARLSDVINGGYDDSLEDEEMDFSCKLPSDSSTSSEASRTHAGANMMISASSSHVDEEAPTACITQFSSTSPPPIPPAEVEESPATEASTSLTNPQALNVLAGDSVSTESQEDDDCNVYLRFLTPPTESDITLSGSSVLTYHAGGDADTERDLVSAPLSPQISDPQQLLFSQSISRQQNFSRSTTSSEQPVASSSPMWCHSKHPTSHPRRRTGLSRKVRCKPLHQTLR